MDVCRRFPGGGGGEEGGRRGGDGQSYFNFISHLFHRLLSLCHGSTSFAEEISELEREFKPTPDRRLELFFLETAKITSHSPMAVGLLTLVNLSEILQLEYFQLVRRF